MSQKSEAGKPEELKAALQAYAAVDLDHAFDGFHRQTGQASWGAFLSYLYQQGKLSYTAFAAVQALGGPGVENKTYPRARSEIPVGTPYEQPGRYQLDQKLGEGGMGTVYAAVDVPLQRRLAKKMLKIDPLMEGELLGRFVDEAQVTAQLDHPNIVPLYNLEMDPQGSLSFTLKLVDGKTLDDYIEECVGRHQRGEPLGDTHSLETRLEHFLKACDALDYAHDKGVVHRDIKPTNILVGIHHEVYVMDWGIARLIRGTEGRKGRVKLTTRQADGVDLNRTLRGQVLGTPGYMSPEQAKGGDDLDGRSDLFALGLVLQELVTLRTAIPGETAPDRMKSTIRGIREPIVHMVPGEHVPKELRAIIEKATQLDREKRYPTVEAMAQDIRRFLRGEKVSVLQEGALESASRWLAKHRHVAAAGLLAAVVLVLMIMIVSLAHRFSLVEQAQYVAEVRSALQTKVFEHGHAIDRQVLALEMQCERLARLARQALEHGAAGEGGSAIYDAAHLDDPARAPTDYVPSDLYRRPVSVTYPAYKLAPGVEETALRGDLQRLAPLGPAMRETLLASFRERPVGVSAEDRALRTDGGTVRWAYLGLEKGVMWSFPAKSGYAVDYDPRKRPWYIDARGRRDPVWSAPYVDALGQGIVITCSAPILAGDGKLLGVAGLDLTLRDLVRGLLSMPEEAAVTEVLLLDAEARVILRGSSAARGDASKDTLALTPFEGEAVRALVKSGRSGLIALDGAQPQLAACYRLGTIGWTYVALADAERLFAR